MNKNIITPEHPRARHIVCEVDEVEIKKVVWIDLDKKEICVACTDRTYTYVDKEGNSTTVTADRDSFDCVFKPKQFKAYDEETLEFYALWNTYGHRTS